MQKKQSKDEIHVWLENAGRFPVLSKERTILIAKEIQSLPEKSVKRKKLVNILVRHNLRLVVRFVNSFMSGTCHNKWGSPETVDYLQVGALGLIRAAEMYDPTKGYTFSTYANHWIRSKVSRYNLKNKTIVHVSESMARKLVFYNRNGYLKAKRTGRLIDDAVAKPAIEEVQNAFSCLSLNEKTEHGLELINFVVDERKADSENNVYEQLHKGLDEVGVSPLGKEILMSYYMHEDSLSDIAERLNINIHKARREKSIAMRLAKRSNTLKGLV